MRTDDVVIDVSAIRYFGVQGQCGGNFWCSDAVGVEQCGYGDLQ
jgi:hypothetical protein